MNKDLKKYYKRLKNIKKIQKSGIWFWILEFILVILGVLVSILVFNQCIGI